MNCFNSYLPTVRLSQKYSNRDEFPVQYGIFMHDGTISPRGEFGTIKLVLKPPLCIELVVPSQENERSCICVLEVMYLCVRGIDFASLYEFWNCSDILVFFCVFHLL